MAGSSVLIERTQRFAAEVDKLTFSGSFYVYNPLVYAWEAHKTYLQRYVDKPVKTMFLGMNPGPFGMAQTGVPFGEIDAVRRWMGITASVGKPPHEHPKRPITGFSTKRSEVSGRRLWSLMEQKFSSAQVFFSEHAVMNYCPLVFVDSGSTGKNIVPEKLVKEERIALEHICDEYLKDVIDLLYPINLVGVGVYAEAKLRKAVSDDTTKHVTAICHPSPGNPKANAGWAALVERQLVEAVIWS